jgi:hypothetical protein
VLELYGSDFQLTLDEYFTQLEAMITALEAGSSSTAAFKVSQLQTKRTNLLDALSATLEESADVAKTTSVGHKKPCGYHRSIVEALSPKDTIISFNYDCVIDHALRTTGIAKWSARHGYGFFKPSRVVGYQPWNAEKAPDAQNRSINLLKLHGSLNWFPFPEDQASGEIKLRERPYKQNGQKRYEIIPPEYVKTVASRPIFRELWSRAELALRKASVLAFVGFSFTPTDLDVEALFRLALVNSPLKRVVIVNPDTAHRKRIRKILAPALGARKARVVQFDRFSDAARHLGELLSSD